MVNDAGMFDAMVHHGGGSVAGGCAAHHVMTPRELLEQAEEGEELDLECQRQELFSALVGYVFADGAHPVDVVSRFYAAMRGLAYEGVGVVAAEVFYVLVDRQVEVSRGDFVEAALRVIFGDDAEECEVRSMEIDHVLRKNEKRLSAVSEGAVGHAPLCDLISMSEAAQDEGVDFVGPIFDYLSASGCVPLDALRMMYVLAKPLRPELIGGMSLEALAVLGGDGGRATVSARARRKYNDYIEENGGGRVNAHYQTGDATCEKYSAAQKGNKNRNKNMRRRR